MPRRSLLALWFFSSLVALCDGSPTRAQGRPAIPEIRCTAVSLEVLPRSGTHAREVGLRVVNDDPGDFPAHLRSEVEVQRRVDGAWTRVSVAGLQLRETCGPVGETVTIEPDGVLRMVPWTGMLGDGQCLCTRCAPAPAGTYRFVLHSEARCFQPNTFESAPFELPAP